MYLKTLRLTNFRSFYGTHEINFTNIPGMYKVQGVIGSGKSTLSMGILYGLFGSINNQNQSDLISWGEKHGSVELNIESKGHDINIKREINSYGQNPCSVIIDGEPLVSSNKRGIQQSLEEYLDVSRLSMELLCIISFNNFKSLSSMNTKDINDFQNQILGFSLIDDYRNESKETAKELSQESKTIETDALRLTVREEEILNKPKKIEGDIDELKSKLKDIENKYKEQLSLLQEDTNKKDQEVRDIQTKITQVVSEGKRIAKDIEFIKKGVCPTCGAPIDQSHLEEKSQLKDQLMDQYKSLSNEKTKKENVYNESKRTLDNYRDEQSQKISSIKNHISQLELQQQYIDDDSEELEKINIKRAELYEQLEEINNEQQKYEDLGKLLGDPMRTKLTSNFIVPINNRCRQICQQANLQFVPVFNENFKCYIERNNEVVPVSSLSTGQSKMIDMICILSIISSIINSSRCNVIFLDELFSNLDSKSREIMLQIIPTIFPSNSTILIVSHQDLNDNYLKGAINLSLVDGRSEMEIISFE